ncbi:hypothetical protein [Streptomyces sp. M10]|uniref:hypothetical protein n=1 Tax=Streptomyces sp. M10 TaxID=412968 RepID=UPI000646FF20|nr:hypothetical protein [Streptomyces sp. M10]
MKALARQYGIDPKTVRRVLDDAGAREVPDDLSSLVDGEDQDDVADDDEGHRPGQRARGDDRALRDRAHAVARRP